MNHKTTSPQRPFAVMFGLVLGLTLAALLPLVPSQPATAANVSIPLFANAVGWGQTSGGETNPGPTLLVYHNDQITVTLTSDGTRRSFEVTVPAGVTDGQRIRLAGQDEAAP